MTISRRKALGGSLGIVAGAAALPVLAKPAIASSVTEWRMVTSWPKNLPGPGVTAQRLADRITGMSGGRLTVRLFAAGELVPALETFDAVANGTAQMAHTASLFWAGKFPVAPIFTAAPFGLTPIEHITWIDHGGGEKLWDELYDGAGIKPFMAGNTGFQMGGWFKQEVNSPSDLVGLKIRMPGLGGAAMRKLGAAPVVLPPGEIFTALQAGVIDATEFLGPFSDMAMGFHRVAKNYYSPGWHEPNGTGEALVSQSALGALDTELQAIVRAACSATNIEALGESEWANAEALAALETEHGVTVREFPAEVVEALRIAAKDALDELAGAGGLTGRIVASYRAAASHQSRWSDVSVRSFLAARG